MVTQARLHELLSYDPETGILYWRGSKRGVRMGQPAGNPSRGYLQLMVEGHQTFVHRFIWLYVYGKWPEGNIDHIDGNRSNNRICNLRDVTQSTNIQNERKPRRNNKSGFLGVKADRGRWRAEISISGKTKFLGRFKTPEEAHQAYVESKRKNHPGFML
jgi:hypothetical protein